jgi:Condensation domain
MTSVASYRDVRASLAQERRVIVDEQHGAGRDRLVRIAFAVAGPLDTEVLGAALAHVVARHDALRTSFHRVGDAVVQRVHASVPAPLEVDEAPAGPGWLEERAGRPLDRAVPPPLRLSVARAGPGRHLLALVTDHLVLDGWAMKVVLGELGDAYAALLEGRAPALPPVAVQLSEWSEAQRARLSGERLRRLAGHWRARLGDDPNVIALPLAGRLPPQGPPLFRGERLRAPVPPERLAGLRALAAAERATLYLAVLACLARVLREASGRDRVVVTTSFANRAGAGLARTVGRLSHPMILALDLAGAADLPAALRAVRLAVFDTLGDAELPFELLRREVWPSTYRATTTEPTVYFDVAAPPWHDLRLAGASVEPVEWEDESCIPGLEFLAHDVDGGLDVSLGYELTTYSGAYAGEILARFLDQVDRAGAGG